jgi:cyclic beta-1,2-glucan synthetase
MAPPAPSLASPAGPAPSARILGNGTYRVLLTAAGTGSSHAGRDALTRWRADPVEDADGFFIYLRDRESGHVWSAGLAPVEAHPSRYEARSRPGIFTIAREDEGIESLLEVGVLPDHAAEVRSLTLVNRSARRRVIEITSFAEVVLLEPAAHEAHPVFSKLFVQTEFATVERALLARRRPRGHGDDHPWLVHAIAAPGDVEWETDRTRFLGRGRCAADPAALRTAAPLSGATGNVLDPIVSLRSVVELSPGASASVAFLLGAAPGREAALALPALIAAPGGAAAALGTAERAARDRLGRLFLSPADAEYWEALAGAALYGHPALRAEPAVLARAHGDLGSLRRHGLDAQTVLVVLHAENPAGTVLLPEVLRGYGYWQTLGLPITLAVISDESSGPGLPPSCAGPLRVLRTRDLGPADRDLIDAAARLVITDAWPALGADAPPGPVAAGGEPPARDHEPAPAALALDSPPSPPPSESLQFWNGSGGFSADGHEYVIRLAPDPGGGLRLPPRPWTNVIANERFGLLLSETGAGNTWSGNSREHRLTPWSNDPLADPHEEAFYVLDLETGRFWSPLPGPAPLAATYEMRHGFGASTCRVSGAGLDQETTIFVPPRDPVRVTAIRLRNTSGRAHRLSLFAYYRLVLGATPAESGRYIMTEKDAASGATFARNRLSAEFGGCIAFSAVVRPPDGDGARTGGLRSTGDRAAFLGLRGSATRPAAVAHGAGLDGRTGTGFDPCLAEEITLDLAPGATAEIAFLLGEAASEAAARELLARYAGPGAVESALAVTRAFWENGLSQLTIATPEPAIDLMVNGWLPYQALSCRIWGRTALYQSGGAFGFRDQLQDAASLVPLWPALTRAQILLHAAHQFPEGDVLHWWHPPLDRGIRSRCSDDLVWLPYLTAHYLATTGDHGILEERVPFVTARELAPGEDEAFLASTVTAESADLYTHCCLAFDRALTAGRHGLPLFGTGDWNDGMNRVGREGRGESVWLGFFLYTALGDFMPLCAERGDAARAERYRAFRDGLRRALDDGGWDGAWYRRGYYDSGEPLGSRSSDECRIDALAQAWAVISKAAPPERAASALDAIERHLVSEEDGMIRLLTPPFAHTPHDPGYIKGYVPGARENGGQYTHAALWVVRALAEAGRNERAAKLLAMLSPVTRTATPARLAVYGAEPYVVAADIHGAPPHVGRAGWTWYTGSAGWMYRVALESLLGFRVVGGRALELAPRVPANWPRFTIRYRLPGEETVYEIEARNEGGEADLTAVRLDGAPIPIVAGAAAIPLAHDGRTHRVELDLGRKAGDRP